jgi:signal transduction histidine kinase
MLVSAAPHRPPPITITGRAPRPARAEVGSPSNLGALLATTGRTLSRAFSARRRRAEEAARVRAAAAAYDERRRVVRDLHDGAQQRLVHTVVVLKLACQALERDEGSARMLVGEALEQAQEAHRELRELANGISPSVLTCGGLAAGVRALVERTPVPVAVDVSAGRLPSAVETAAYFVVAEALTNIAKHAQARTASVAVWLDTGALRAEIRDDGVGGADSKGNGLVGLRNRVGELGGKLEVTTSPGCGTRVAATIPLVR